ncbi:hypothetical protein [Kribbella sp. DT2]|uniref:hypothetical protein n=1 Tax=Kribbella sp. DT2 TaxID=3393427 RepID=UPI003CE89527
MIEPDDPGLVELRDALVEELGGAADVSGAIDLTDRVYLGRVVQDQVPPIVTAHCIWWYGSWRLANQGPSLAMAEAMRLLAQSWLDQPDRRQEIDGAIRAKARDAIGEDPAPLLELAV